ncbi:hypothetical protein EMWEY_00048590, partial [Eimeria maxima]
RPDSPDGGDGSAVTEGEVGSTLGEDSTSDKGGVPPLPTAPPVPPPVSEAAGVPVAEAAITQTPGSEQVPEEPESGSADGDELEGFGDGGGEGAVASGGAGSEPESADTIVVGNVVFLDNVGFGQDLQGFDAIVDDVVYGLSE